MRGNLQRRLQTPVSNAFLIAFRVFFGVWMAVRCAWYLWSHDVEYVEHTNVLFAFRGWQWLPHLPGTWIVGGVWLALLAAIALALGLMTRVSAAVFAVCFGYFFFVDAATWGNVDYLCTLLAVYFTFVPGLRRLGVDALISRRREVETPIWVYWLLQVQLGVVYFYAGIIKTTSDWLIHAQPIRIFFSNENQVPALAPILTNDTIIHFLAFGGWAFDLFIVFALLNRRTRLVGMAFVLFFHTFNYFVLGLGIIPSFMIVSTLIVFLEPDRLEFLIRGAELRTRRLPVSEFRPSSRFALGLAAFFAATQLIVPLRHFAYPGDGRWNGDGQNFSWWMRSIHMDVEAKFYAVYDGKREPLDPLQDIAPQQVSMGKDPDMMAQYARYMAHKLAPTSGDVRIEVDAFASLNGRPKQRFIKQGLDLAALPPDFSPNDIVEPLLPFPTEN